MTVRSTSGRIPLGPGKAIRVILFLALLFVITLLLGFSIGSVDISIARILRIIFEGEGGTDRTILTEIRLPRVLLAACVGAGLSTAGVVFQALLRNPLAEPYILGISSGGTVGALAVLWLLPAAAAFVAPVAAFAGCVAVMGVVFFLGHRRGQLDTYAILLAGVMVGAFFNAVVLVGFAMLYQDMKGAFLLLMGNLSGAGSGSLALAGVCTLAVSGYFVMKAGSFNLIATGDETALHLGIDVNRFRRTAYILASLLTGVAVSLSGIIGFVGLIIPHIFRMWLGPDHRLLLPASFLGGAIFLILADILSRTLIAPAEIPVGAVTAAIGAPLFLYLLHRDR